MANINSILQERTKQSQNSSKMQAMAKQSANGKLTSFSGIFSVSDLSEKEKEKISEILNTYLVDDQDINQDFESLISLTSEVKAINNQAAILHGERIKKAHQILTRYRDGAFTAWLIAAYGNRQTPYNLMQYYEFYEAMPKNLRPQIELMPRQAVYVLATRTGELETKQALVKNYQGETKAEMLTLIRQTFPLSSEDKRKQKFELTVIQSLEKLCKQLRQNPCRFSAHQKAEIQVYLQQLQRMAGLS
ncbi:MAG: CT583 family protein [Chlamydiales bacterium]